MSFVKIGAFSDITPLIIFLPPIPIFSVFWDSTDVNVGSCGGVPQILEALFILFPSLSSLCCLGCVPCVGLSSGVLVLSSVVSTLLWRLLATCLTSLVYFSFPLIFTL